MDDAPAGSTDWTAWHRDYDDPGSQLSQRLSVVVARIRDAVDELPDGPIRLISACAGQGRDVVTALRGHPRRGDVTGLLVESDPLNCDAAGLALTAAGLAGLRVVCGDASMTDAYLDAAPADLVLLCGIFGNVPDEDVQRTVTSAASLCSPGAYVIWTRHRRHPDLTPRIREWFLAGGFAEAAFDSPGPERFAVGTQRLVTPASTPLEPGLRLFSFFR